MKKSDLIKHIPNPTAGADVLLLTHTDLDGSGAAIVLRKAYYFDNIDVIHCPNVKMSSMIRDTVLSNETWDNYDYVFACDISVNEADARLIDESNNKDKFLLLDHHNTATELNKYDWAVVCSNIIEDSYRTLLYPSDKLNIAHSSGTSLMFDYLNATGVYAGDNNSITSKYPFITNLVHKIAIYDTWDWVYAFEHDEEAHMLCRLFGAYGGDMFEVIETRKPDDDTLFDYFDKRVILITQSNIEETIRAVHKRYERYDAVINDVAYKMLYANATRFIDDIFTDMHERYPDCDIYCINTGTSLSFRSRKANVDVGKIAKTFGGGGHNEAAGCPIPKSLILDAVEQTLHSRLKRVASEEIVYK